MRNQVGQEVDHRRGPGREDSVAASLVLTVGNKLSPSSVFSGTIQVPEKTVSNDGRRWSDWQSGGAGRAAIQNCLVHRRQQQQEDDASQMGTILASTAVAMATGE